MSKTFTRIMPPVKPVYLDNKGGEHPNAREATLQTLANRFHKDAEDFDIFPWDGIEIYSVLDLLEVLAEMGPMGIDLAEQFAYNYAEALNHDMEDDL